MVLLDINPYVNKRFLRNAHKLLSSLLILLFSAVSARAQVVVDLALIMCNLKYSVPAEYDPHELKGTFAGFMECHVESDFLLIWFDEQNKQIRLVRLGTHSELFKL